MTRMLSIFPLVACVFSAVQVFAAGGPVTQESRSMIPLRTHSLHAPYVDQDLQNRWFSFGGDAYVNTNKHIRLTQDRPSETGWLWSRLPISVPNFQIDIEFKIGGNSAHLVGDGMAIWLTKTRTEFGPVFGSLDKFEGIGIFFDTYANSRHSYSFPRIMAMIGDGATSYDLDKDGQPNEADACSANIRKTDIATKARLSYVKDEGLKVLLQYKAWDEWTPCIELKNYTMISTPYLGVTAITGDVHDAHDVISINANSIVISNSADSPVGTGSNPAKPYGVSQSGGSWTWFFVKLLLFGGVCAGAFQGYQVYVVRNGQWNSKRF